MIESTPPTLAMLADTAAPMVVALAFAAAILSVIITAIIMKIIERARHAGQMAEFDAIRKAAEAKAQEIIAKAEATAKTQSLQRREEFDAETEATRRQLREEEKRLAKREDTLDQKLETVNTKERMLETSQKALVEREQALTKKDRQLNELIAQQRTQLMKVAQMSKEEAQRHVLEQVAKEMETESAQLIQQRLDAAKETAEEQAREILITAIQRYAADHTAEATVSTVTIPSDDMKGRVIGREGRNIRAFENATGVDVIVDDTPGAVVVSAFDPVRREIARKALEKLIVDGRIHPARIEEVVAATDKEVRKLIVERGKAAVVEAKVRGLHNKLVELLGRLSYRTSYGQNVLQHSMEVAYLAGMIAEDLGLNGTIARRAGLLHDIGKAVDHEVEGGHPQIGADLLKRYGEKDEIVNASAAHHGDTAVESYYTPIVAAADAISASRPGARREMLERYVQRLQKLEEIATAFEGVKQAYAIQAGREVRVMVDAENVDDRLSSKIARDIARRIEEEMEYPGEVRITLVREVRCVEYAR
ncbi:MAG: ribonuclease Y [Planctomycetaceae bacterium]|nr:ribonuclease Y [Planctomycetaceae bacterium]